jgi:hypothetical protein
MTSKMKAGGTFPFVMEDDRDQATPPVFLIRVLSAYDDAEVSRIRSDFIAAKDAMERLAFTQEAITKCVAEAPEGMAVAELTHRITAVGCWHLINAATEGASLTVEQRKKYVSPASSETDSSVEDVPVSV